VIVMKFGGTSVGSAERIRGVAELVRRRQERHPVVVVSALSGITDRLIQAARLAVDRDPGTDAAIEGVATRHREVLTELFPDGPVRERLEAHVDALIQELRKFF
jgi:aspartokinase